MPVAYPARASADISGDFVVFLIGMRINVLHRPDLWWPAFSAMPKMLRELASRPEAGLLGARTRWAGRHIEVVQYWRSWEHLHGYARSRDAAHWPAWVAFNRKVAGSGAVGIWHEAYQIAEGRYSATYRSMPLHGLAAIAPAPTPPVS